jgi:hypothetical protein
MKKQAKTIIPLTILAVLLITTAPMAAASTLTVNLNPNTKIARVDSVSTTKIVFTYPAGSPMSNFLKNVSSSQTLQGTFNGGSQGVEQLQTSFDDEDSHVSVSNMSVTVDYTATGSPTSLVINKMTNVTAWVSGVFNVVNGSVTANLRWRSFVVRDAMNLPLEDHPIDINLVGATMENTLSSHETAANFLVNMFAGESLWYRPTMNFSALNSPLSTWTKNYDASTNTTTFSKTISGQSTFTASADFNGQNYSLSVVSDPSGVVSVQGYANASGDSLVMAPAPASMTADYLAVAVAAVALLAGVGYIALRTRTKSRIASTNTTVPS